MSSRYEGLEREASRRSRSLHTAANGNGSAFPAAEVHEGPVRAVHCVRRMLYILLVLTPPTIV